MVVERFIKLWSVKSIEKITSHNSCSYLDYLGKIVNEYNNPYHYSISKKPIDADYSALTKNNELIKDHKGPKLKVGDE